MLYVTFCNTEQELLHRPLIKPVDTFAPYDTRGAPSVEVAAPPQPVVVNDDNVKVEVLNDAADHVDHIIPPARHPTPAAHASGGNPDNGLHPVQNAASMADVYFLGTHPLCCVIIVLHALL